MDAGLNLGVYLRLAGCVLMICGATGYGICLAARYRHRLELLMKLRQMIYLLKGQITYANATLAEALRLVGERSEGTLAELFCDAAKRMEEKPGEPFRQIWEASVGLLDEDVALTKKDRQELVSMGEYLGYLNRDMQERNLLLYLEELDDGIQDLKEHQKEKCRLYTSLGIMSGIFLAVILI
jgi:stage III sporulation protein AB